MLEHFCKTCQRTYVSTTTFANAVLVAVSLTFAVGFLVLWGSSTVTGQNGNSQDPAVANAQRLITAGREAFRSDTFGDEAFWGGQLRLHEAINGAALGGVGPGLTRVERCSWD